MHFISFFIEKIKIEKKKKKENLIIRENKFSRKIWPFAKISSRKMSKKFIRENKFSRRLIPLR